MRDRADEARAALGRAAALIAPGAAGRAVLDFRRGLIAENLARSPQAARAAYRRAHAGATAHSDPLLLSFTWRHLAGLALREGELAEARHGFAESLRIREELGYLVGTAAGARFAGRRGGGAGGVAAAGGGPAAVPVAGGRAHLAGTTVDPTGRGGGHRVTRWRLDRRRLPVTERRPVRALARAGCGPLYGADSGLCPVRRPGVPDAAP